jgi:hypothetical protein
MQDGEVYNNISERKRKKKNIEQNKIHLSSSWIFGGTKNLITPDSNVINYI